MILEWTKFHAQGTITVREGSGAEYHGVGYWECSTPQQKYVIEICINKQDLGNI